MTAYIITCNDASKAVVIDDEKKALDECTKMAHHDFNRQGGFNSFDEYQQCAFWHIHSVPVL